MEDPKPISAAESGRDALGRFAAGNPGKPKGTGNKLKKAISDYLAKFLADKAEDLYTLYDGLDAKDKLTLYIQIGRMVLPREQPFEEIDGNDNFRQLTIEIINNEKD